MELGWWVGSISWCCLLIRSQKSCFLCCKTTDQHAIVLFQLFMLWESYEPFHKLGGASALWVSAFHRTCLAQLLVWWRCRPHFLLVDFFQEGLFALG